MRNLLSCLPLRNALHSGPTSVAVVALTRGLYTLSLHMSFVEMTYFKSPCWIGGEWEGGGQNPLGRDAGKLQDA